MNDWIRFSEVDAELRAEHQHVLETARAAWPNDVFETGLDEEDALTQIEATGQFHHGVVVPAIPVGTKQ